MPNSKLNCYDQMEGPSIHVLNEVMQGIPSDVWLLILSYLGVVNLLRAQSVCKTWYSWAHLNRAWLPNVVRMQRICPELKPLFDKYSDEAEMGLGKQVEVAAPSQKKRTRFGPKRQSRIWIKPNGYWRVFQRLWLHRSLIDEYYFKCLCVRICLPSKIIMSFERRTGYYGSIAYSKALFFVNENAQGFLELGRGHNWSFGDLLENDHCVCEFLDNNVIIVCNPWQVIIGHDIERRPLDDETEENPWWIQMKTFY